MKSQKISNCRQASLLLGCVLLCGCTQWHRDLGTQLTQADVPDPGTGMSLAQVLFSLGPPQRLSATGNGYVLAWEHWHIKENTLGLSLGLLGANLLSIDWGEAKVQGEFLLLTFNREHQLTASTLSQWENNAGGGQAIQPFLGMISMTDVDDLSTRMPQHNWGGGFLQPLPSALNIDSSPDSGQNGIEQRGTPRAIGQQSLEMD